MRKSEYEKLEGLHDVFTVDDLVNKDDRTLLFGYTLERDTWHVYLEKGEIITIKYNGCMALSVPERIDIRDNQRFIPSKRLYPECCDYEFCKLLKLEGYYLPFTFYDEERGQATYYGRRL